MNINIKSQVENTRDDFEGQVAAWTRAYNASLYQTAFRLGVCVSSR